MKEELGGICCLSGMVVRVLNPCTTPSLHINPFTSGVVIPNDYYLKHGHNLLYPLCCLLTYLSLSTRHT